MSYRIFCRFKLIVSRIGILITVVIIAISSSLYAQTGNLKIEKIEPVTYFGEPPYVQIEISYPMSWGEGSFRFTVNGENTAFEKRGGGFGQGLYDNDFWLYIGEPGKKEITVTFKSSSLTTQRKELFEFKSNGDLVLLNHYDGETLFKETPFQFFTYFVRNIKLTLNGTEVPYVIQTVPASKVHSLVVFKPQFTSGLNTVQFSGKRFDNKDFIRQFSFFFIKDATVKTGDQFNFGYGYPGSKSGPFFELKIDGAALTLDDERREASFPVLQTDQWLIHKSTYLQTVTAKEPGTGSIMVLEQGSFLDPDFKEISRTAITVRKRLP
jgi:hypothetical protein